jgi:hypothetical protein
MSKSRAEIADDEFEIIYRDLLRQHGGAKAFNTAQIAIARQLALLLARIGSLKLTRFRGLRNICVERVTMKISPIIPVAKKEIT